MKNIALLSMVILFLGTPDVFSAEKTQVSPTSVEQKKQADTKDVDSENAEKQKENTDNSAENGDEKPQKEVFLSPEAKAKQEIADNNYSLSFFVQRMDLDLDQLDKAKQFSDEDRLKRDSLLRSIYMLREQSRELEQQSLEKFKGILTPGQLAVFEELRKEQVNYRDKYDVLAGSVEQLVHREESNIAAYEEELAKELKKDEERKKTEKARRKSRFDSIRHGRWENSE